jgi:hypothetical protein
VMYKHRSGLPSHCFAPLTLRQCLAFVVAA